MKKLKNFLLNILYFIKGNIIFISITFILILVLNIKLPFTVYSPGSLINVNDRLSSSGKGSINMTYVSALEGTIPSYILSLILPNYDRIPNSDIKFDSETMVDANERGKVQLKTSISNAIYVAYKNAGQELTNYTYNFYIIYKLDEANTNLKIGDMILSYDGRNDFDNLMDYIKNKNIGDKIIFKVKYDDKEYDRYAVIIDVDGEAKVGVSLAKINNYEDDIITYKYNKNEEGSSGGLMMSLAIYNALVDEDITDGKKICGTGTIDEDGIVGEIDGVKYKLAGAVKKKCDVFISPTDNLEEAKKVIKNNNYKIKLIEGKTFDQVLKELNNI